MTTNIDLYVGRKLRRRRRLLGMTQQELADKLGIRFQQIHKYECGINRITASRLFEFSRALSVPIQYFYDGLKGYEPQTHAANDQNAIDRETLNKKETQELIEAYWNLSEVAKCRLLDLARAMSKIETTAA